LISSFQLIPLLKIELEKTSGSGGKFFGVECDLDKDEDIQKMFNLIKNHPELGRVDVCICNAGQLLIKSDLINNQSKITLPYLLK